jgi:hypothetical protein
MAASAAAATPVMNFLLRILGPFRVVFACA